LIPASSFIPDFLAFGAGAGAAAGASAAGAAAAGAAAAGAASSAKTGETSRTNMRAAKKFFILLLLAFRFFLNSFKAQTGFVALLCLWVLNSSMIGLSYLF
jgi:hypothetical protein